MQKSILTIFVALLTLSVVSAAYYDGSQASFTDDRVYTFSNDYSYSNFGCNECQIYKHTPIVRNSPEVVHIQQDNVAPCRSCVTYHTVPNYRNSPEVVHSLDFMSRCY